MAKRRRRPKCGFNKRGKAVAGRTAGGQIKRGYRIAKGGRVVKRKARK